MSKVTQLASGQITEAASITVELVEARDACSRPRPVALHGAADVGGATAVRGGRPGRWGRAGLRWLRAGR
jgi:hypothetical protein